MMPKIPIVPVIWAPLCTEETCLEDQLQATSKLTVSWCFFLRHTQAGKAGKEIEKCPPAWNFGDWNNWTWYRIKIVTALCLNLFLSPQVKWHVNVYQPLFFLLPREAYLPTACLSNRHLTGDWCQIWALFSRHVKVNVCVFLAGWLVVCGPQCLHTSSLISSLISRYGFGHPCHIPLATHYHHKHRLTVTSTIFKPTVQFWDLSVALMVTPVSVTIYQMLEQSPILQHHCIILGKKKNPSLSPFKPLKPKGTFVVR